MRRLFIIIVSVLLIMWAFTITSCSSVHKGDAYGQGKQGNVVGYNRMR